MLKKVLSFVLVMAILFSVIPVYSENLTQINETKSETSLRMQPLIDKYYSLTSAEIQIQADKYKDITNHFGKDYISKLAALNILVGDGVSKFNPNDTLLACQFIKMIVMAIGYIPERYGANWWDAYVDIALKEGIIKAGEITDYTKPITRELAGTIGFRTLMKYTSQPSGEDVWFDYNVSKISDYAYISDQYKNDVVMAYRMGILQGSNNLYVPKGTLTRAQGAVIVNKLMDKNIRIESVPKPEEIITYTRRTELDEAMFEYKIKPGQVFKIYPGYFPLNEIYTAFKTMYDNLDKFGGHPELLFNGLSSNIAIWEYLNKEDADYFYLVDNQLPKHFAGFCVYLSKCYIKDQLSNNNTGYLYDIATHDPQDYDKYMKVFTYEMFKVLFEDEAKEAIKFHDYYLNIALSKKPPEWKTYMINNRMVHFTGDGKTGGFGIEIWAKGAISKDNMGS